MVIVLTSCKKGSYRELPAITTEGKHTFGCLVNGSLFYPKGAAFGVNQRSVTNLQNNFKLTRQYGDKYIVIEFSCTGSGKPSSYCISFYADNDSCTYKLCDAVAGEINILKLDREKKIISATFSASLKANDGCAAINITNGRFDYIYE